MKHILCLTFWLSCLILAPAAATAQAPSFTFFQGTQYPLTAYFLRGQRPGPTVMVQGGIQGDETSGFLTAQILASATVNRGNLIVVPRANLPSVHARSRQVNVDLNRRFDRDYNRFYEDNLARVIRFLIAGADAFIHLHEGSGFYSPTYVNVWRNPKRYGQSIIIDTPIFQNRIHLAQAVTSILPRLNGTIVPADYHFSLFNTNTFAPNTSHPEQRKSLTYYALSEPGIPALAIEVSKNIKDLGWKVIQQLKATHLFLESFGVDVTLPYVTEKDVRAYAATAATITVNNVPVRPGATAMVAVEPGQSIRAVATSAKGLLPPSPAVMAKDRPGLNILQNPRLALAPTTELNVLADGLPVGSVRVSWKSRSKAQTPATGQRPLFACWLNNKLNFVPAGETLDAVQGDRLMVDGVWGSKHKIDVLNVKGYVSQPGRNDGQDIGQEIILDPETFISRYVKHDADGWLCRVVRETPGMKRHQFHIRIRPRSVQALSLTAADGRRILLPWKNNTQALLPPGQYRLETAWSNGTADHLLPTQGTAAMPWGSTLTLEPGQTATITIRQQTTFKPIGSMSLIAPNS